MEAFVHSLHLPPPNLAYPALGLLPVVLEIVPWEAVCICQMTECINSFQRRSWCPILASGPSSFLFSSLISSKADVDSHLMPVCISQSFPKPGKVKRMILTPEMTVAIIVTYVYKKQ